MLRNLAFATAATTMVVTPIAAQAAPVARSAAPVAAESELRSGDLWRALIIVLIAAVGMGLLLATDDDDNSVSA